MRKIQFICTLVLLIMFSSCAKENSYLGYAVKLSDSQMIHDPQLWMSDGVTQPKWDYTQGLIARAMMATYKATGDERYLQYVQEFADYFVEEDGSIKTYKLDAYNIDRVNGGIFLFDLNEVNPHPQYKAAIDLLRSQLATHPRTSEGGFWHKKIYPWQMWLDGLYMGEPFYAHYGALYGPDTIFTDVVRQYQVVDKYTLKPNGLNYHAWDESHEMFWSNPETGTSEHSWGRAQGWYVMSIVDVLDYMPADWQGRDELIAILNRVCNALLTVQDPETKMWYQVLDHPGEEGNYTESTCTAMFIYAFAKGARMGYLPESFRQQAREAFDGLWQSAVTYNEENQSYDLNRCCAVAGLGGKEMRSGTYDYYIHEKIRSNDPKGVGPLILAAIELSK